MVRSACIRIRECVGGKMAAGLMTVVVISDRGLRLNLRPC